MSTGKGLVLDANILIRAVFGTRVRTLLETYEDSASFFSPDVCFQDAREYIPEVAARQRIEASASFAVLDAISRIVESVDCSLYEQCIRQASASRPVTLKIGLLLPSRCSWGIPSGRKIRIFLDWGFPHGRPIRLRSI